MYRPKLGDDLDLDGYFVKDVGATLFGRTDGKMTMMKDLDMNTYSIRQPKLRGNLNLNNNAVYNNDTLLFRYSDRWSHSLLKTCVLDRYVLSNGQCCCYGGLQRTLVVLSRPAGAKRTIAPFQHYSLEGAVVSRNERPCVC